MMKQTMHTRGFTLVETLVAISVLLLALAGPLSIAADALSGAYYARDQITAFYLAQEGVEYVRAVRDENYLAGRAWLTGLDTCVSGTCVVDFPNFTHASCTGSCPPILINSSGLFNQANGTPSLYTRGVSLQPVDADDHEMRIVVTVSWRSGVINRSFEIREYIFDWL
jgi:prepilin-type N-terminal cleavage/methylation domain-containing protein